MQPLIQLKDATVTRGAVRLAGPLNWQLMRGEHVAIIGHNGSGKTTLLRLVRGELLPDTGGERVYDFGDGSQHSVVGLRQRIGLVSADMQDFYFLHATRTVGRSIVLAGFFDTPLLYEVATPEQKTAADAIIAHLGIEVLADRAIGTLSTGQVRKLLIARALVSGPDILLLDECLEGLDIHSRCEILTCIEKAAQRSTVVCVAHRIGDVPKNISRTVVMDDGHILLEGGRDEAVEVLRERAPGVVSCDMPVVENSSDYEYLLRMENVSVVSEGVRFLHSINWEVLPGENWAVLGDNGAGKSTLLKLVLSEIAPYADDDDGVGIVKRLGGLTMDEARPLIGFVSPAFQATYGRKLGWEVTALETVLSGYRGSVGMLDEPTSDELAGAGEWLERVGLGELANRPLRRMSYGQQRRVLLARAMAPGPRLLLLDEPLAGLDTLARRLVLDLLQKFSEVGTPLLLVTHHVEDIIPAINKVLLLDKGRQIFCGAREEFEMSSVMG